MLTLYDCRFILFVHTLNGLTSISIEILVTGLDWVSNVNDFLFSEILEVHIFCPINLLLVFGDLKPHFVDKVDSYRVQKFLTEAMFHVGQYNEEESPATSVFTVLGFK